MKTIYRIKEIVRKNECTFMPQYSHFGIIWCHWYRCYDEYFTRDLICDTMKEAEEFIQKKCNEDVITNYYHKVECKK